MRNITRIAITALTAGAIAVGGAAPAFAAETVKPINCETFKAASVDAVDGFLRTIERNAAAEQSAWKAAIKADLAKQYSTLDADVAAASVVQRRAMAEFKANQSAETAAVVNIAIGNRTSYEKERTYRKQVYKRYLTDLLAARDAQSRLTLGQTVYTALQGASASSYAVCLAVTT